MAIRLQGVDKPSTINEPSSIHHGTRHLTDNPNLYEIQRSNHFDFVVTDLDGIQRAGTLGTESNAFFPNAQEILRASVDRASVPHFTQTPITINRGNTTMKFAGSIQFGEGSLAINDFIGANSKEVLMAWQNLSGNVRTEKVGLASDYKKTAYLIEYTPDYQKVRQWILYGCWVSGISEDEFNSSSNDKRTITATIQYDRAILDTSEDI